MIPHDDDNGVFDRILVLVTAQHEGALTPEQLAELDALVVGDPRAAAAYVECVEQTASLRLWAAAEQSRNLDSSLGEDGPLAAPTLSDAVVLPALSDPPAPQPVRGPDPTGMAAVRRGPDKRSNAARWWWATAAVAAGLAAALVPVFRAPTGPTVGPARSVPQVAITTTPSMPRPVAVLSATAAAVLRDDPAASPGGAVAVGQTLDLTAGAVEVTFDTGTVVVVSAPARVRVLGRDLLDLDSGSLAARVAPADVGFRVDSPDLSVVDRGTEFGVRTGGDEAGSVASVFQGSVDVTPVRTTTSAARVTAGHAVAHAAGDPSPLRDAAYAPAEFVRRIDALRLPVPLHGTGADVAFEAVDPNWQLVAGPDDPKPYAAPRSVYAVALRADTFAAPTAAAKWVSLTPKASDAAEGNYTFRTSVDLPEFTPGTLSVTADVAADDWITDVRVNGTGTAAANAAVAGRPSRTGPLGWTLAGAPWRPGRNQVDVVVWNKPAFKGMHNNMALKLAWTASLCPVVRRSGPADSP